MAGGESDNAPLATGFCFVVGVVFAWLAFIIAAPMIAIWVLNSGTGVIAGVDPELVVPASLGAAEATALADDYARVRVQDAFSEVEFARTSFLNPILGTAVYKKDCLEEEGADAYNYDECQVQMCIAPVLRTCGLLAGGTPEQSVIQGSNVTVISDSKNLACVTGVKSCCAHLQAELS